VPIGQYTRSKKNKEYAIAAYHLLTEYQRLAANEEELWQRVTERKGVRQNQQMDVVLSLWKHDRLAR
jgi:hemerythrin superfamily protein